jgi:hypothetical protein
VFLKPKKAAIRKLCSNTVLADSRFLEYDYGFMAFLLKENQSA